ncbi:uncharacterized protein LOC142553285 [Primulina tabacum]|uniref:uncharacterized protein LOC142553285 n=1 Tax=Primulina tabacum TaxID=48773 RepID=UPI003F590986
MLASAVISPSPSFNSYSNSNLAEVASRVVQEFGDDADEQEKQTIPGIYGAETSDSAEKYDGREEKEFKFAFVWRGSESVLPPISADEIFHNGMIRPVYPIFNPNTKYHGSVDESRMNSGLLKAGVKTGTPLRKLFTEERETSTISSCSSSEADELDGVSAEMYCVWQPKPSVEGRLKKSSSTGWKFKGFPLKSHSVGSNGSFAIASLNNGVRKRDECVMESPASEHGVWKDEVVYLSSSRTASKSMPSPYKRDGWKKWSYLPYRHHVDGFLANVNKLSKNFHPF